MSEQGVPGGASGAVAGLLVRFRFVVVTLWLLIIFVLLFVLPPIQHAGGSSSLAGLVPADTPAITTELKEVDQFGFPLTGRIAVVQRDPDGLSLFAQARTAVAAAAVTKQKIPRLNLVRGALPLTNTVGLLTETGEPGTTAVTYLLFDPDRSVTSQTNLARDYVRHFFSPLDHVVGITGSVPARTQQGNLIRDALPTVELTTLLAVLVIIGLAMRSLVAPVISLLAAGASYVVTLRLSDLATHLLGISPPSELEPVIVALLLGVVTDYVVFFLTAMRRELAAGHDRKTAARAATARFGPIVVVAGLAVAAGTAVLLLAHSVFFRALGPALAVTVLVALAVATTLVPALMAIGGRGCFWPSHPERQVSRGTPRRDRLVEAVAHSRRRSAGVVAACVVALGAGAVPLLHLSLGVSLVGSLPADTGVRQAADAARTGIAPGILSPTTVVLEGLHLDRRITGLNRFEQLIGHADGVAGVIGPADLSPRLRRAVLVTKDGSAARFLVVLDQPALGGAAISSLERIQDQLPAFAVNSGLERAGPVSIGVAGDTAAGVTIVEETNSDLVRIAIAALLANLLMLVLFLRSAVASPLLLVGSLLSLAAAIGLTSLVFGLTDPGAGLTFYVPFSAAVLLLAFGSDYNIYAVGSVWSEAPLVRTLGASLRAAMPEVMGAMLIAGLTLAASFGLLSVVPLLPFRQLALAMALGILLDVVVVRSLLLPALLNLVGPIVAWPSRRFEDAEPVQSGEA